MALSSFGMSAWSIENNLMGGPTLLRPAAALAPARSCRDPFQVTGKILLEVPRGQWPHHNVAEDPFKRPIDEAANALQAAVLLAASIERDQRELRSAIARAARALAALKPSNG